MRIRLYRSGQALYGVAKALYWKSSERQISTHLTVFKHQNTKSHKLSKIIRFLHFLNFLGSSEKDYNLQSLMITLYVKKVKLNPNNNPNIFSEIIELQANRGSGGIQTQIPN